MSRNNTSYSEVNDFNKCQKYWFNKYVRGLRRKGIQGGPRTFGTLGHLWLQHYYKYLMEATGSNVVDYPTRIMAIGNANTELALAFATGRYDKSIWGPLSDLLSEYIRRESGFHFDILGVEKYMGDILPRDGVDKYDPADPDNIYVTGIVDLIIRPHHGKFKGQIGVMDHKFVENFPADIAVNINSQLPKQMHLLRGNGINATFGVLNHLRTRQAKDISKLDLFKRNYPPCGETRIENFMREHELTSRQIIYLKNIDPDEAETKVTKVANPFFCGTRSDKECEFLTLCNEELDGKSTKATIEAFFIQKGSK